MYNPIINNKLNKLVKKDARERIFLNMNDIYSIFVLFDTKDYEQVDNFIEQLESMGKHVTAYAYKDKKDKYDYSETSYKIINYKEVSGWFNRKVDTIADEIKKNRYDALFDLTIHKNIILEYLLVAANATLKVGYKKSNFQLYDFTISSLKMAKDQKRFKIRELGKQIIHYLSTINMNI
jgi:hypothetical protein